jgi:hypothetical protein
MTATNEGWQFAASVCRYDARTHRVRIFFDRADVGPQLSRMAWLDVRGARPPDGARLVEYVHVDMDDPTHAVCEFVAGPVDDE